jgi:hypothetical protein
VLGLTLGSALHAQSLTIRSASSVAGAAPALQLALSIELGPRATEALQAGLLLAFDIDWQLDDGRQLQRAMALRYSPLLRSYQLAIGSEAPQVFTLRNGLLAAMENARLRWPDQPPCAGDCGGRVRARLNPAALPAPLRLPALFDSDWDFDSGWKELESGARGTGHGARGIGGGAQLGASPSYDHSIESSGLAVHSETPRNSRAPCPVPRAPLHRHSPRAPFHRRPSA